MKNLMKTLILFALLAFSSNLFAQTAIGLRGGVNLATYNDSPFGTMTNDFDMPFMAGVDVAVFTKVEISGIFSVQPELHWMQKGVRFRMKAADDTKVTMNYRYNYLEVPVLARFDFGTEAIGFNFFVGPSAGYAMNGKYKGKNARYGQGYETPVQKGEYKKDLEWDKEFGTDGTKSNRFDISGVAGVGMEFALGEANIVLDARYNLDLNDATIYENKPTPDPDKYYNRSIALTAGIAIPIFKVQ
jgi:hypothetical protein